MHSICYNVCMEVKRKEKNNMTTNLFTSKSNRVNITFDTKLIGFGVSGYAEGGSWFINFSFLFLHLYLSNLC